LCASLASGSATEFEISVPQGWTIDGLETYDASPISNAVVAYQFQDNRVVRSVVIQAMLDGTQYTTEFDTKVSFLQYASDGSSLFVRRGLERLPDERVLGETCLLDNQGQVLWSRVDTRSYRFSSDGSVIWAWRTPPMDARPQENEIEIFDLSGESLKTIEKTRPLGVSWSWGHGTRFYSQTR
jgi:hypothetical protein